MRTIEKVNSEIKGLEKQLEKVEGTNTEVYTRIVGYHRAVDNWNKGKKEEYIERVTFNHDSKGIDEKLEADIFKHAFDLDMKTREESQECSSTSEKVSGEIAHYKFFQSEFCVNCPPVKDYVAGIELPGEELDVSTDLGLEIAKKYNILTTPSVLLFDANDNLVTEVHTVKDLKDILLPSEKMAV